MPILILDEPVTKTGTLVFDNPTPEETNYYQSSYQGPADPNDVSKRAGEVFDLAIKDNISLLEADSIVRRDQEDEEIDQHKYTPTTLASLFRSMNETIAEIPKGLVSGTEQMIGTAGSLVQWAHDVSPLANTVRAARMYNTLHKLKDPSLPIEDKRQSVADFLVDKDWLSNKIGKWNDFWTEQANTGWEAPNPEILNAKWTEKPGQKAIQVTARAAPNYLVSIVATLLTKNPKTGLMFISSISAADAYERQREAGAGVPKATGIGLIIGAWEYVTEKVPFDELFKPAKNLFAKMLKVGTLESAQEFVQGIGENFLEYFGYTAKDLDTVPAAVKEGLAHTLDGWVENVVAGFGLGMGGAGVVGTGAVPEGGREAPGVAQEPRTAVEGMVTTPQGKIAAEKPAPAAEKAEEPKAEMKVSRLAERTAERAIAAGIEEDFGHLPEYATMNMAEQARLGIDLVKRDKPRARRIIQMQEEPPAPLRAGSVFMALEFEAIATKNGELSLELSKSPLAQHFSALGQEIKALDVGIEHSPVKALKKLADTLESVVKKKLGVRDLKTVREKTAKTVKAEVRERVNKTGSKRPTWEQFIKSIECA